MKNQYMSKNLKENDVICFLGDSITASGLWIAEIYDYFVSVKREKKVKIINCGVPGDTASNALSRLFSDCLSFFPNHVVIMFGANDIDRDLYMDSCINPEKLKLRKTKVDEYTFAMETIVEHCKTANAHVILCTPTPCDEIHNYNTEIIHSSEVFDTIKNIVNTLAEKYECSVVDFNSIMKQRLLCEEIFKEDRVHPNEYGEHIMAQEFLFQTGFIPKTEYQSKYVMSEKNSVRYATESYIKRLDFVKFCILSKYPELNLEQKKMHIRKMLENETSDYSIDCFNLYINEIDFENNIKSKLIMETLDFIS